MTIKGLTDMKPLPTEFIVAVCCEQHWPGERYLAWPTGFTNEVTMDVERARTFTDIEEAVRSMDNLVVSYCNLNVEVQAKVLTRKVVRMNGHWELVPSDMLAGVR